MTGKTIVIGLDGATFDLIGPWVKSGDLPNLQKIIQNGASGELESCLPPVTSPNWKCYSTGKNPGKLGIFWWENIDCEKREITVPRERTISHREIWDYIGEKGDKVGVINTPLTYPPKKVEGIMISGPPDAEDENYTNPSELEAWLRDKFDYRVNPRWLNFLKDGSEKAVDEVLEMIDARFKVASRLLEERNLGFLHLTIFYINTLHHFFWNGSPVREGWNIIDKNLGSLLEDFPDVNLFLLSDHGSNPIKRIFYVNTWLEKEGYLKTKGLKSSQFLHKLGIEQDRLVKIAQTLGIKKTLKKALPEEIWARIPSEVGTIEKEHKTERIDWEKTKALASGQGPIYINKKQKELREEILKKLEKIKDPNTGKEIASKIWRKEEIYTGEFLSKAPDLIIDQSPGTHIRGGIGKPKIFESPKGWKAENKKNGIFVAYGPGIRKGYKVRGISILDLAPTLLHLKQIPIPRDMDGQVRKEIFRKDSEPAGREVEYQDVGTEAEERRIKKQIRKK